MTTHWKNSPYFGVYLIHRLKIYGYIPLNPISTIQIKKKNVRNSQFKFQFDQTVNESRDSNKVAGIWQKFLHCLRGLRNQIRPESGVFKGYIFIHIGKKISSMNKNSTIFPFPIMWRKRHYGNQATSSNFPLGKDLVKMPKPFVICVNLFMLK